MEHVVFYPSVEAGPAFKRVNSLDEAVAFVEHLRNSENITDFSVHTLTPVPVSFRAYYHVEVPAEDAAAEPAMPTDPTPEPAAEDEPPVAEVEEAPADAEVVADAPVAEAAAEVVAAAVPETVEVPAQAEAPELSPTDDVTIAPVDAVDADRSEEWVAEAAVVEPPAKTPEAAPVDEPVVAAGPFAEAPPVTPQSTEDVVPVPTGKRTMGFFAR